MTTRYRHAALLALATLVACGGAAVRTAATPSTPTMRVPAPSPSPNPTAFTPTAAPGTVAARLWLGRNGEQPIIEVVDVPALHTVATMPAGVIAPDWTRMYTLSTDAGFGPALHVLDPRTGAQLDRVRTGTGLEFAEGNGFAAGSAAGMSPAGRRLVLDGGPTDGNGRRTTSEFSIYDTAALHATPQEVSLPGDFGFAAVDDASRNLYLTQYTLQADNTSTASLRRYDLVHDNLDHNPVVARGGGGAPETMNGANDSVSTRDGAWVLSLSIFGTSGPWVQALDLATATARRIPLPGNSPSSTSYDERDLLWSFTISHDGRHVYAANVALGVVADISAAPPFAIRTATLPTPPPSPSPASWWPLGVTTAEAKRILQGGALLSPDDRTLYAAADNGVAVIDTRTLSLRRTLLPDQPPESLALSPDGHVLYVVSAAQSGGLYQVDTTTAAVVSIPGYDDVSAVLRAAPPQ